jgi:hypothetical protein
MSSTSLQLSTQVNALEGIWGREKSEMTAVGST